LTACCHGCCARRGAAGRASLADRVWVRALLCCAQVVREGDGARGLVPASYVTLEGQ
jgi:hypothetical protein